MVARRKPDTQSKIKHNADASRYASGCCLCLRMNGLSESDPIKVKAGNLEYWRGFQSMQTIVPSQYVYKSFEHKVIKNRYQ